MVAIIPMMPVLQKEACGGLNGDPPHQRAMSTS